MFLRLCILYNYNGHHDSMQCMMYRVPYRPQASYGLTYILQIYAEMSGKAQMARCGAIDEEGHEVS